MIISEKLKENLNLLPHEPGVYFMYDDNDKIIYIGKAKILYKRIKQYFNQRRSNSHYASYLIQGKICKIDWTVTDTEEEALILEANLIKQHQPRYNVMLKDDKHYPYLRVSISETYPRVYIARKVDSKSKDLFFGPYTYSHSLRKILEIIYKIFHIRDCDLILPSKRKIQPCLSYRINRCDAPCDNSITPESYKKLVQDTILFLEGKNTTIIKNLKQKMFAYSQSQKYELATQVRDQIYHLERIIKNAKN